MVIDKLLQFIYATAANDSHGLGASACRSWRFRFRFLTGACESLFRVRMYCACERECSVYDIPDIGETLVKSYEKHYY